MACTRWVLWLRGGIGLTVATLVNGQGCGEAAARPDLVEVGVANSKHSLSLFQAGLVRRPARQDLR